MISTCYNCCCRRRRRRRRRRGGVLVWLFVFDSKLWCMIIEQCIHCGAE